MPDQPTLRGHIIGEILANATLSVRTPPQDITAS